LRINTAVRTAAVCAIPAIFAATAARAGSFPFDASLFPSPDSLLTDDMKNAFTKTVGLTTDFRPMEPATPLGTWIGLDFGIEVTVSKVPSDLAASLDKIGMSGLNIPILPALRAQAHKGITKNIDIGFGGIYYKGAGKIPQLKLIGASLKIALYNPDQGPTIALRGCYSISKIMIVSTTNYSAQLLASRKMDFADPYIGIGFQYITGIIKVELPIMGFTITAEGTGKAMAGSAFTGVQFTVPNLGLQLTLEGGYNSGGAHGLGMKIGMGF